MHVHKVEKNKGQSDFDSDGKGTIVVKNVSLQPVSIGSPSINLYPGDEAFSCDDNEKVLAAVKKGLLSISKTGSSKSKYKKPKVEETSSTVAEPEVDVSVQLASPEQGEALPDAGF